MGWMVAVLEYCETGPKSSREIQDLTGFRHRETFQRNYLDLLLTDELLEPTIPDKPTSRLQKYRLTQKGRAWLNRHKPNGGAK
jgi:ATP-dependent DNA helicase RecG